MALTTSAVESDIVGYMGNALDNDFGAKAMVIPFANVGQADKSFKLADIKPVVAGDNVSESDLINAISFQRLDNSGYTIDGSDRFWDGTKWTTFNGEDKSNETYAPGAGLWVYNASYNPSTFECGAVNLQSSGKVIEENVIVDLDNDFGAVFIGNPFPVAIKISSIIPYVTEGSVAANTISFQKLDNSGYTVTDSDRFWDGSKWTTFAGADMSNDTLAAGESVWIYNTNYDSTTFECIPGKVRFVAPTF